jgi:hypothetical protein
VKDQPNTFDVKIMPLRKDAPIFLPTGAWPGFDGLEMAEIRSIQAVPEYEVVVDWK